MKLILESYPCKNFIVCVGKIPANTKVLKEATTTPAVRSQLVGMLSGSVSYVANNGATIGVLETNTITDVYDIGQNNIYYTAGNEDAYYVSVNPQTVNQKFTAQMITTPTTQNIVGSDKLTIVVCLGGSITCNNKDIPATKYAKILNGITTNLEVLAESAALIVTEK
jgi:hypothetical protein